MNLANKRLKISIVSVNLSTNCTNRCYRIAQALQPDYDVEIVGTQWGSSIWPPLADCEIPIKGVPGDYFPGYIKSIRQLIKMLDGDIVIACKPRFSSFGVALIKRFFSGTPVILDVDDDELAQTLPGKGKSFIEKLRNPIGYYHTRLAHLFHRSANAVFTVSVYFQRIYGGTLVPHGRDPIEMDPDSYVRETVREQIGIPPTEFSLVFIGTPEPQKGIEQILVALDKIEFSHLKLTIVGASPHNSFVNKLQSDHPYRIRLIPPQPVNKIAYYLSAADLVVLPQRAVRESFGQMPAKLTDAMAMGKTIIASNLADIPKYLEGRGLVIEPDSTEALTESISWVVNNPYEAQRMGERARAFFLSELTLNVMRREMQKELSRVVTLCRDRT